MKIKQFKIGEYAIGGIIKVIIYDNIVSIDALDYTTKKSIPFIKESFNLNDKHKIDSYLNELTSCYYSNKILEYIYN